MIYSGDFIDSQGMGQNTVGGIFPWCHDFQRGMPADFPHVRLLKRSLFQALVWGTGLGTQACLPFIPAVKVVSLLWSLGEATSGTWDLWSWKGPVSTSKLRVGSGVPAWPLAILSQSRLIGGLKIRGSEEGNEATAEGQKILEPHGLTRCCCLG